MKIFKESINRGIWDVVVNGFFIHMHVVKDENIEKNGPNGLQLKVKKLNVILELKTLLHLL